MLFATLLECAILLTERPAVCSLFPNLRMVSRYQRMSLSSTLDKPRLSSISQESHLLIFAILSQLFVISLITSQSSIMMVICSLTTSNSVAVTGVESTVMITQAVSSPAVTTQILLLTTTAMVSLESIQQLTNHTKTSGVKVLDRWVSPSLVIVPLLISEFLPLTSLLRPLI